MTMASYELDERFEQMPATGLVETDIAIRDTIVCAGPAPIREMRSLSGRGLSVDPSEWERVNR